MNDTLVPLGIVVALVGVLGLLVGSFLNVVVHRVPAGLSIVSPGSACPACGHEVRALDNVPVVSWLVLRGHCRDCAAPISARYPLVELGTGVLFALCAWRFTDPVELAIALVVAGGGLALALIDIELGRLPFAITRVMGALVALALAIGAVAGADLPSPLTIALSPVLWFGVYGGLWFLTAGRGMGLGDVALAPVLGLAIAPQGLGASTIGVFGGFVIGAVVAVPVLVAHRGAPAVPAQPDRGRDADLDLGTDAGEVDAEADPSSAEERPGRTRLRVPHGPHMLLGAALALAAGADLWDRYLRLVGLA